MDEKQLAELYRDSYDIPLNEEFIHNITEEGEF